MSQVEKGPTERFAIRCLGSFYLSPLQPCKIVFSLGTVSFYSLSKLGVFDGRRGGGDLQVLKFVLELPFRVFGASKSLVNVVPRRWQLTTLFALSQLLSFYPLLKTRDLTL